MSLNLQYSPNGPRVQPVDKASESRTACSEVPPSSSVPHISVQVTGGVLGLSDPGGIRHGRWRTASRPVVHTMPVRDSSGPLSGPGGGKLGQLKRTQTETEIVVAECSVCLEEYDYQSKVPRSLHCGHTFCSSCLKQLLQKSPVTDPQIDCAKCHRVTPVANRNISNLPKNFALLEVIRTLSASPIPAIQYTDGSDGERASSQPPAPKCPEHGNILSNFCTKDGALVCSSCLVYGSHKDHKMLPVPQAAVEYREKLYKLSPEVLGQKRRMEEAMQVVEEVIQRVQEKGQELERETDERFQELIGLVEEKRDQVRVEIMERTQIRVQTLMEQSSNLHECIEKANAVHHSAEELVQFDDHTLLEGVMLTLDQVEGVFTNPPPTIPRAKDNLSCQFSSSPTDELASLLTGYGNIRSDVGTVDNLRVEAYHDGIRVSWESYDFADNQGMSYHLQVSAGSSDYRIIYRGSATKFTWKEDLEYNAPYRFRVQVRTTEGVGNWCEPKEVLKPPPAFHWHNQWCNVKIELSQDKLEAYWSKGKTHHYWATFAGDRFFSGHGQHYCEIEIVNFGKTKPHKKLAIGVIGCSRSEAANLPWQDGKHAVGQLEVKSWSFHPISGTLNSHTLAQEGVSYVPNIELQNGDRIGMLLDLDTKKLSFFYNRQDLGVAFDDLDARVFLPAVSIRDKIRVRLRFPPPPYYKRVVQLIQFTSGGGIVTSTSAPNLEVLGLNSSGRFQRPSTPTHMANTYR